METARPTRHATGARGAAAWLVVAAAMLGGCAGGGPAPRRALQSSYAFDRARAAVRLAEAGDRQAVHALVDLLEDDDAGVRFYAIAALERLCGATHGYR